MTNFIEHKLRPGDALVVPGHGIGVLTRQTKKYWYYYFQQVPCKVRKDKLWLNIDKGKIEVSYGSTLKRRRKKRKERTLDLHGCAHGDVEEVTKKFLNFVELPCKIITGNSTKMKAKVRSIVYEYVWKCQEESDFNQGTLIVIEGNLTNNKKGEKNV